MLLLIVALCASVQLHGQVPAIEGQIKEAAALRYIDVAEGGGATAAAGQEYTVHYTGWLRDGTKFDSSRDRNEPIQFVQGRRQVIAGWDAGFEGMKVGGKRRLLIPYQFAYGERGSGPIPAKAELIFDVELIGVRDVPQQPAAQDVLLPFSELESKAIALAKAAPEEKYSWRPAPGVRSFGEVFLHIANGNQLLLNIATEQPDKKALARQIESNAKNENQARTKAEVIEILTASFVPVRKVLESARAGQLMRDAQFFSASTTFRGILIMLNVHIAEHVGQAIAYARMNGIEPPWTKSE